MEVFLLIVLGIAVLGFWAASSARKEEERKRQRRREAAERRKQVEEAKEKEIGEYALARQSEGWEYISQGRLMHVTGQPPCFMLMSPSEKELRLDRYDHKENLKIEDTQLIKVSDIVSIKIDRPKTTGMRKETVPVSIVESKNKSPIGRGLVGGVLLGPAGLILGAASGLNSKTTTRVENQTVYREYETLGAPQLIIGTKLMERPFFKIRCETQELAEEWMFRIRALQT